METYLDRASTNRNAEINWLIQQRNAMVGRAEGGLGLDNTGVAQTRQIYSQNATALHVLTAVLG